MKNKFLRNSSFALLLYGVGVCTGGGVQSLRAENPQETKIAVTGVVSDADGPVIGASVVEKGSPGNGTASDVDGKYTLRVLPNATLEISYLGYATQEVPVNGQTTINVTLSEDASQLEEVVVVGYGTQRKVNLTGAVSTVDSKALSSRPIQNVSGALQGLMSGVTIQSGEGRPGQDGATIRVRGVGTLNNASPYILIDGVESGTINAIDPSDIESISVLKDAASAAIYGSKASNGVILITTKRGKEGKSVVSYNGFYGVQTATKLVERLSSYDQARLYNRALTEDGQPARFTTDDLQKFKDGSDPYGHPNTDWYGLGFQTGYQHQHNVSVSGGAKNMSYQASVGFLQQEGILRNAERQQFNGRTNLDFKISEKLSARVNMAYIKNDYKDPVTSYAPGTSSDQVIRQLNIIAPWIVNKDADGNYGTMSDGNPIASLDLEQTVDRYDQNFTGLVAADYLITDGLKLTLQGAYIGNIQHFKMFVKDIQYNPSKYYGPNSLDERFYLWNRTNFDALLNYDKQFGVHGVKVLAGWHTEKYNYSENTMGRKSFPNNDLTDMDAGAESTRTNGGFTRELAMLSGFGRVNYDYANKYLLEANIRADASSRFSPKHRWGYFPSFSAGWRLSEESFMESTHDVLSNLKIRASWGLLGNQDALDDYYPYMSTYNLGGSYMFGGSLGSGYYQSTFRKEDISWEKSRTYGFGIDATIIEHVNASIDYYDRETTDIIMDVPAPAEFGLGTYKDNVGSMSNRGVELSLGYNNKWGDWSLQATGNFAYNKNEILALSGVKQIINDNGYQINRIGEAISSYYVYQTDGFFQSQGEVDEFTAKYNKANGTTMFGYDFKPGDIRYVDSNGDGKINADDRVLCNSTNPVYTFGLNTTVGYKDFDLSLLFSGAAKQSRIFTEEAFGDFRGDATHPSTAWLDAWTPDNTDASMPRVTNARRSNNSAQDIRSTFWLQNTSFLRLKNLQLGYNVPSQWLAKAGISKLRVYYSVENLFTVDNMPINIDPEITSARSSSYPLIRTHSFGLNLTF
ncbi:SusC/RagA family TonB-linked outer membrane protein [Bacteroidia bacterium]|nr:SusC/RagA family TonB-linked outer membrane protein [Bacteroidia bacterium]